MGLRWSRVAWGIRRRHSDVRAAAGAACWGFVHRPIPYASRRVYVCVCVCRLLDKFGVELFVAELRASEVVTRDVHAWTRLGW